jgi:type I restriction enzyme S subunit
MIGETRPLGSLLRRPPRYGINAAAVSSALGLPTYLRITDIDDAGRFAPNPKVAVDNSKSSEYRMERGELVFARTGASVGKSYLYDPRDGELIYAGFLINIAPDPKQLNPRYLSLFAHSKGYWDWIARTSVRSGQPGVNGREYAQLPVPLPDIAVQDAIARAMTDVDDLITSFARMTAKKEAIKLGLMQRLLTGRSRLPGFGAPWGKTPLGTIGVVTMGQSPVGSSYNDAGRGTPLIQGNADISNRRSVARIWTSEPTKRCRAGDVIVTVRAPVGHVALATYDSCLGRGVCAIDAGTDNRLLFHALVFAEPSWAVFEQGSTFTAVNSGEVRAFAIAWPSDPAERHAIAAVLDDADSELGWCRRQQGKAEAIKQGMMQALLSGRARLGSSGEAA